MSYFTEDKPSTPPPLQPSNPAQSLSTPPTLQPSNPAQSPSTPQTLETTNPKFRIRSFCKPEEIRRYTFDGQFGAHAQYKSLYTKKESLENNSSQDNANVTLALEGENIIGFGVLNHPDDGERWQEMEPGLMMEVKAIEICRRFRSYGIAGKILELLMQPPTVADLIVYMVGYSWTWDLDGTGKSALEYRNILIRLFEPSGFQELQTNEPNICLKPENLFMACIGQRVSAENQKKFKWLRFGVTP
jgi:acetoin utilization protein AcuA